MRLDIFAEVVRYGVGEVIRRDGRKSVTMCGMAPSYQACEHFVVWAEGSSLWVLVTTPTLSVIAITPTEQVAHAV